MTDQTMTTSTRGARQRGADESEFRSLAPSQWLGLVTAVIFVAVGVAGFFVTGFDDFAEHNTEEHLLGFEVNPLHNIVHLALGLIGLALIWKLRGALTYGLIVLIGYGAALIYGLAAVGEDWDFLSLNTADNWLHLALAVLGLVIAALAYRDIGEATARHARHNGRDPGLTRR
jgi:hypothetical protein